MSTAVEDEQPRWPAWYAPAAFVVGLSATLLVGAVVLGMLAALTGTDDPGESPTFTILGTLIQSLVFIGTAVAFASMSGRPRAWQFGLRRTRFWRAVGWTALGVVAFMVFSIVYGVLVQPDYEQPVTDELGADQGTLGLIVAGFMVIVIAPVAEELFFRGFFYRALRSRFTVVVAAVIDGLVFGVIHYDFSGTDALLILPPLAVLGVVFCLVYEKTGSLFPVIALHALNNTIAFAEQTESWEVSVALGPLMLLACAAGPRLMSPRPRPLPAPG